MLCMVFGQLTSRDSLRDLILSLEAIVPNTIIWGSGPPYRGVTSVPPTKKGATGSLRSSPTY
jgi:hypothetical protein